MRELKILENEYYATKKRMREIRSQYRDSNKFFKAWDYWRYNPESEPLMAEYIKLMKHLPNLRTNINQAKMREMNKR